MTNESLSNANECHEETPIVRPGSAKEIPRGVLRKKLQKQRHLVIEKCIEPSYLDSLFPDILNLFDPQTVTVSFNDIGQTYESIARNYLTYSYLATIFHVYFSFFLSSTMVE